MRQPIPLEHPVIDGGEGHRPLTYFPADDMGNRRSQASGPRESPTPGENRSGSRKRDLSLHRAGRTRSACLRLRWIRDTFAASRHQRASRSGRDETMARREGPDLVVESRAVSGRRGSGRLRDRPFAHGSVSAGRRLRIRRRRTAVSGQPHRTESRDQPGAPVFAEKMVARYPTASSVDVRFNPKRPGEPVLEPRVPAGWILLAVIAVALLALAVRIYKSET